MKNLISLLAAAALLPAMPAWAAAPDDAAGLWMTAENDAVIRFAPCADRAASLCGQIVWDKDAGTPADTCGVQIARLERYENEAWRDGWVYDPRDKKKYKGVVRIKSGDDLHIRAFLGVEILGKTEQLKRVPAVPAAPACKP
ncbi:DUF2147 domain-containing protein [Ideonella sp.]|uniref:DUF2147 domain-containing protein n=1 Tax=Ideonella sp. TaxID=1929293 RepID=UPI002B48C9BF|nr:DUF2147 domain-containing protein [Ideonella sp.]HJV69628.1 DUF2147 domain-containing protein [Ideonella sp.]